MGSVSLPTPLSPAVGSRGNAYRLACLRLFLPLAGSAIGICRPALAPVPDRRLDSQGSCEADPDRSGRLSVAGALALASPAAPPGSKLSRGSIDVGAHRLVHPITDPCGFNSPGSLGPKASFPLSYTAMMLSSRRARFGFPLPVSAGDTGSWSVFALDGLRMRMGAESGKGASVDLSTSRRNASGQGWISQRLGADRETTSPLQHENRNFERRTNGLAAPAGGVARRSA